LTVSANLPGWVRGLARRFRSALDSLVGAVPLTAASVSVRPREDGPLEVLATYTCTGDISVSSTPLTLGEPAVRWLEVHRRELVLEVRPSHADSAFYHPFIVAGVKRVLVVPVYQGNVLAGTLLVASDEPDAYTMRHLKLVRLLAGELAPFFPRPAPVRPSATPLAAAPRSTDKPFLTARELAQRGEAVVETDELGRIETWEGAAEGMFGLSRREVLGACLALFYRRKVKRLLDPTLLDDLLAEGAFRGRALCYSNEGLPVTCEVELSRLDAGEGRATGFRGRFRQVMPETLLPREKITFGFARLYAFGNPLTDESRGNRG